MIIARSDRGDLRGDLLILFSSLYIRESSELRIACECTPMHVRHPHAVTARD